MLYTKKGDGGTTKLFDSQSGIRISKTKLIFEALGTVDELNSALGFAKTLAEKDGVEIYKNLEKIQENLFTTQAHLAGADKHLTEKNVEELEAMIAQAEKYLPEIKSFIISGGTPLGAYLDFSRAISRRAERTVLRLKESEERNINEATLKYLNRLSSVLYAMARLANKNGNISERAPKYK